MNEPKTTKSNRKHKKPDTAVQAAVAKRRGDAIELRLAGLDNISIGRKLASDPMINMDGLSYPFGYGNERYAAGEGPPDEYELSRLVSEDIRRALKDRIIREDNATDEMRQIELQRLDRVFLVAWRQALGGDLQAIDRVLKIQERRAKLYGLDINTHRLTGVNGGPIALDISVEDLQAKISQFVGNHSDPDEV